MKAKTCIKCGTTKPLADFYVHPLMADGHEGACKKCRNAYCGANQKTDRGRANHNKAVAKSQLKYPERVRAREIVANAIIVGTLTREPCEICGEALAEAHHEDYSRPLAVRWLCQPHHKAVHRKYSPLILPDIQLPRAA